VAFDGCVSEIGVYRYIENSPLEPQKWFVCILENLVQKKKKETGLFGLGGTLQSK
jgi:hypothetical protein